MGVEPLANSVFVKTIKTACLYVKRSNLGSDHHTEGSDKRNEQGNV